jgi:hypothetical protein
VVGGCVNMGATIAKESVKICATVREARHIVKNVIV